MATPPTGRPTGLRNLGVLILDDDPRIAQIVRDILTDLGFNKVYIGRDGSAGLRMMREHVIDLIITDWRMEPMDGIDFIRHVRHDKDSPNRYVPIIMLTGQAEAEDVEVARDAGVNEFVVKPFTVRRLVDRLMLIIDNPRGFVLARDFKGPDRRRRKTPPPGGTDRRKRRG
jgi:DNA-binding response OmpR family regulator